MGLVRMRYEMQTLFWWCLLQRNPKRQCAAAAEWPKIAVAMPRSGFHVLGFFEVDVVNESCFVHAEERRGDGAQTGTFDKRQYFR